MNGTSSYAECLSCPTYKFFCEQTKGRWLNSPIILERFFYIVLTSQRQGDKLHALPTHDGPTETTVVPPVSDVKLVSTVGAERDIRVIHPRHHWLLNGFENGNKDICVSENKTISFSWALNYCKQTSDFGCVWANSVKRRQLNGTWMYRVKICLSGTQFQRVQKYYVNKLCYETQHH